MAEKVEDLNLPNSSVTRIIKDILPSGVSVSKEARSAIARAACMFVLYLTSSANQVCTRSNRKTISGSDVLKALSETDFEMFIDPLRKAIGEFKQIQMEKKSRLTIKKASDGDTKKDTASPGKSTDDMEIADDADDDEEEDEDTES